MADEKKPKVKKPEEKKLEEKKPKARKKPVEAEGESSVLVEAAKTIGTAAGKIASLVAEAAPAPLHPKSIKPQKLQKKNKSRLPRRQKKALRKAEAARTKG
jgi:hypothetical protein